MASMTLERLRRALILTVSGILLLIVGLVGGPAPAHGRPGGDPVATSVRADITANGTATFLVKLKGQADLTAAAGARGKARAARVFSAKSEYARRAQAGLQRLLRKRGASFTAYWIVNALRVTGDAALLDTVAARPEVERVLPDRRLPLPEPAPGARRAAVGGVASDAVGWNVAQAGAPQVWSAFGVRGENVVVANIDTGVQADHPALAASYRGHDAATHDYTWFDPAGICPTAAPCDNNGHGTHTMGTMVGAGEPAVGLAPGARWIAAKGCESSSCSTSSLLAAGQWIVAPTDLSGANPRPDLAPDVVNNSWGSAGMDPWYTEIVQAWVAAGIFPAFAAGNAGPYCASVGSPGGYDISYASGALDSSGGIAVFSSRGATAEGRVKPNIAAPGADVLSTVPGGGYESYSGTSMASPHTAAAVALLWSAAPGLRGDIAATREILDATAADVDDTSCGGTASFNNVYGEGRLDAFAAVASVLRGAGTLAGTVTAVPGVTVTIDGPLHRQAVVGGDGGYQINRVPVGTYTVTAEAFGYQRATTTVTVVAGADSRADLVLTRLPHAMLSGTVTAGRAGLGGVVMTLAGTPVTGRTDLSGRYRLEVPLGSYELRAAPAGGCASPRAVPVTVDRDTALDVVLDERVDSAGYTCGSPVGGYRAGDRALGLTGDDAVAAVTLPFPVPYYGGTYTQAWISTNGLISFSGAATAFGNGAVPDRTEPNGALYPFWDDLVVDERAAVYVGETPSEYVVEWRDVRFFGESEQRLSISAVIGRDGVVTYHYRGLSGTARSAGASATIGVENADGTIGFAYSVDRPVLTDGSGVTFRPPSG